MSIKKSNEEFLKEAKLLNNKVTVLGTYINNNTKILVKCNECGYEYETLPSSVLKGHGCRKCADRDNAVRYRELHKKNFIEQLSKITNNIILIGEYINNSTETKFKCLNCGEEFYIAPKNIIKNKGNCPHCSKHKLAKSQEEFERDVFNINPNIQVLGEYVNGKTEIKMQCLKCGLIWYPKAT